jgi:hypothetical protein
MKRPPGIAVVGCGYWGKNLVRNFHQLRALRAVCETHAEARDFAASLAGGVKIWDSLEPALDSRKFRESFLPLRQRHTFHWRFNAWQRGKMCSWKNRWP